MPFTVIARYCAAPGNAGHVASLLLKLAQMSRHEPENITYEVSRDLENENRFIIVESYTSEQAFDMHRETRHFVEIGVNGVMPLLADRNVQSFKGRPCTR